VGILLEAVMLGCPEIVEARLIGDDADLDISADASGLGFIPRPKANAGSLKYTDFHLILLGPGGTL
jgi:hypothetical protein